MVYDITEFWVINKGGLPLFCFSPKKNLDPSLIGGFFSAIQSFAKELESDESGTKTQDDYIRNISFGESNYIFRLNDKYDLFFIAKSPKKVKIKRIDSHLKNLESLFIQDFKDHLIKFDGNFSKFEKFLVVIEKYFEDNFVKLKGMW
ncbi:MAG: hypothetical protein ACTSRG_02955 [Candidatus Helarchaeota archaeon]